MPNNSERQASYIAHLEAASDPMLTEGEIHALLTRDDRGITPAPMRQYADLDEFRADANNFPAAFRATPATPSAWYSQRSRKAFQRFGILYPELVDKLSNDIRGTRYGEWEEPVWQNLYAAYQAMSQLVDINDPHVSIDGEVNEWYLWS